MIRAAVIGLGWWGRTIIRTVSGSTLIEPVLGVDPDETCRAAVADAGLATTSRYEDALARDDIDAVILCSPHKFHAAQIVAAAAAGKHVFCEKPLCVTAGEADAAIAAAERAGITIGIGHERRFEPAIIELRSRLAAGEFGEALSLEGNFSQDKFLGLPSNNWRLSAREAPVGPLSATGIHLVDLAIAILGRPKEVWARLATLATPFANGDTLNIMLGFESGATAMLTAILTTPFAGRLAFYGAKGWMEIRDRSHPEQPSGWDVTTVLRDQAPQMRFFPPHPAVRDNLESFARAADGSATYSVTHEEMFLNVRAFEAITRSALSGRIEAV
jgi:predicted dehydrogenase